MSIDAHWQEIERALAVSPQILSSLHPPAQVSDLERWAHTVGGRIPNALQELYGRHEGTGALGDRGFSFIADWHPLPIDLALERYRQTQEFVELAGSPPLIPFAVNLGGSHLAVRVDGDGDLYIIFDDSPPARYKFYSFTTIDELMAETVNGLSGASSEYRAELNEQQLSWINLEEEADDLGY